MMSRVVAFALMVGLVLGFACNPAVQARPLVLGSINADPSDELKDWLPFARHLAAELADDGITEGKVVVARDSKQMIAFLRAGKVDLYIDSPLIMLEVNDAAGSKLLARRWKKGAAEYTAVIFARKDAGIASFDDLKGKVFAFQQVSS
jgi:phosphonate transport system substrate-binding protein